jgi:hypothetical protein
MIELEVYARGLRNGDNVMQLRNQMDLVPSVRYKIDDHHEMVYFEIDEAAEVTLEGINNIFQNIGLEPRFVGQTADALARGSEPAQPL